VLKYKVTFLVIENEIEQEVLTIEHQLSGDIGPFAIILRNCKLLECRALAEFPSEWIIGSSQG
jgi:hypothetical protein